MEINPLNFPMWPNKLPHKAYGTMEATKTDDTVRLVVGKRYLILDLDPKALGPSIAEFDYLVEDENHHYVWVSSEYLKDFIAK